MVPSKSALRKEWLTAIAVSVSVHALIGLAWLGGPNSNERLGSEIGIKVDGPNDHETVFVLRDETPRLIAPPSKNAADVVQTPPVLPPSVSSPATSGPGPGAVTPANYSPKDASPVPKPAGASPLHGALKPGKSIVYVIDRSSSMGVDGYLRQATDAIKASLAHIGLDVRFQIVAYNGGACQLGSELWAANPANSAKATHWLDDLVAEGSSHHRSGILEALRMQPDAIFLLTDADDLDEKEVRAIRALFQNPVCLNVAVFGPHRPAGETPLEQLTRDCGGSVRYVGR